MIPLVDMIRVSIDVSSEMKFRVKMPDRDFIFKTRTIAQCNDWVTILKANKETIDSEVKLKAGIKIIVQPNVSGFVLKTRTVSNPEEKIFVNVFWSDDIDTFISTSNVDRDSQTSSVTDTTSVFSVVLPGYVMESCNSHAAVKDEVRQPNKFGDTPHPQTIYLHVTDYRHLWHGCRRCVGVSYPTSQGAMAWISIRKITRPRRFVGDSSNRNLRSS